MNDEWRRTALLLAVLALGIGFVIYMTTIQTPVNI